MRLKFDWFDGRGFKYREIIDEDTNEVVGHIYSNGVGFGNTGGIDISLFAGKYRATVNKYGECWGFVLGVQSVLNHLIAVPKPKAKPQESNAA
ncbi:hypothetical protein [Bradyrhizobium sp. dw_78]|uniref:hypothetical protein n=1 Tax=Bradyrhizobium sp. dw_78 TaxID=2719793 RepID=UPI001BD33495|nr:hypothetical protein [Bradyrhizobium sp. dw_78]